MSRALTQVCTVLGIEMAAVYKYSASDALMTVAASHGVDRRLANNFAMTVDPNTNFPSLPQIALAARVPVDGSHDSGFPFNICKLTPRGDDRAYAIPLCLRNECVGVLVASVSSERVASRFTTDLVTSVAGIFAYGLLLNRTEEDLGETRRKGHARDSFGYSLAKLHTPTSIMSETSLSTFIHDFVKSRMTHFKTIMQDIAEVFEAQLTELFLPEAPVKLDSEGQIPPLDFTTKFSPLVAHHSADAVFAARKPRDTVAAKDMTRGGLTASVLHTMRGQSSDNVPDDETWSRATYEFDEARMRTWQGVPMIHQFDGDSFCWGVLSTTRTRESLADSRAFKEDELITAKSLANGIATVLARQYEYRLLKTRAAGFVRRFDHDLPNLVSHVDNLVETFVTADEGNVSAVKDALVASSGALRACFSSLLALYTPEARREEHPRIDMNRIRKRLEEVVSLESIGSGTKLTVTDAVDSGYASAGDEDCFLYALFILTQNGYRSCQEKLVLMEGNGYVGEVNICFARDDTHDLIRVTVEDNGVGFSDEMKDPNIIQEGKSFWRDKGNGIGRSLVKRLVDLMGGQNLRFRNLRSGDCTYGACCSFHLPCEKL